MFDLDIFYTSDPLWDGQQCSSEEATCCQVPGIPWFHRVLPSATSDFIELRVCGDQGQFNEDAPVALVEIYIK